VEVVALVGWGQLGEAQLGLDEGQEPALGAGTKTVEAAPEQAQVHRADDLGVLASDSAEGAGT